MRSFAEAARVGLAVALAASLALTSAGSFAQASQQGAASAVGDPETGTPDGRDAQELNAAALTVGLLEDRISEASNATGLEDSERERLTGLYRKALSSLKSAKSYETKAAVFRKALDTAPRQTEEMRALLKRQPSKSGIEPLPEGEGAQDLERRLATLQARVAAAEAKQAELQEERESWPQHPTEARNRLAAAKTELDQVEVQIDRQASTGSPRLAEANRWVLEARQRELRAEIQVLEADLLSYAVRGELLNARVEKVGIELDHLRARQQAVEKALNERRRAEAVEAQAAAEAAKLRTAGKAPLLERLAEGNSNLTKDLTQLTSDLDQASAEHSKVLDENKRIDEKFRNARQRLEVAGLTKALGQVLIDQRSRLPNQRTFRRAQKKREQDIAEATLRQIRYDEERQRLQELNASIAVRTADAGLPENLRGDLRELAQQRGALLEKASAANNAYLRALGDLDYASTELAQTVQGFDAYLGENLLWVRSDPPVGIAAFRGLPAAVAWLLSPQNWFQVGRVLALEAARAPWAWVLILASLMLLWRSRAIVAAIRETAEPLRRVRTDSIKYTLKAVGLGLLPAAALPLLLATLGWQLDRSAEATAFTKAVGQGVLAVAFGLFSLRAFRLLCIPGGVADRHFRWSPATLNTIRRNFDLAIWVLIPIGFVASVAFGHEQSAFNGSLGRITLVALLVGFAFFTARLMQPKTGVASKYLAANRDGWISRLSPLWYTFLVATPLALAALALLGYIYTAGTLLKSLAGELWLILGLTVLHQVVARWLVLTRRRLALRAAIDQQAAREEESRQGPTGPLDAVRQAAEAEVDLAALDERTRKLVNSLVFAGAVIGVWAIYSDVLPALAVLDDISLWSYTGSVDGQEHTVPVTLADIGLTLMIAIVATVAVKNLPALLEILLLQRISISPGSRYAVKTLTGYGIVTIALFMIFNTLGLSWSQVQWLVAALGVGIGFGLQEIVANFISGIIILFERPIRVGDIVTIGDTTGAVTRIQIRATTIRNWDKQELLVPNKELITGRLLNWSLTDQLNRIVVTVGVDYGTDIPQALRLLQEAAEEDSQVLEEPAPLITFEAFGDNALTLVLRCYLNSLDNRLLTTSKLHQSINDKFRAAGISIAFPQRDVHLSTAGPLDVRVRSGGEAGATTSAAAPKTS